MISAPTLKDTYGAVELGPGDAVAGDDAALTKYIKDKMNFTFFHPCEGFSSVYVFRFGRLCLASFHITVHDLLSGGGRDERGDTVCKWLHLPANNVSFTYQSGFGVRLTAMCAEDEMG